MMVDRACLKSGADIWLVWLDIGIAIAGPVLGSVAEQVGYLALFCLASGLTFLAIIIFLTQSKDLPHSLRLPRTRSRYACLEAEVRQKIGDRRQHLIPHLPNSPPAPEPTYGR